MKKGKGKPISSSFDQEVAVKLTPEGEKVCIANKQTILSRLSTEEAAEYIDKRAVVKDRYGWSTFSLWHLMIIFGPIVGKGPTRFPVSSQYFEKGIIRILPK